MAREVSEVFLYCWLVKRMKHVGPLRGSLLRFYNATGDHVRRLQSPAANAKFSGPDAGPDATNARLEGLTSVVTDLRVCPNALGTGLGAMLHVLS